jgi:hypothetical protein
MAAQETEAKANETKKGGQWSATGKKQEAAGGGADAHGDEAAKGNQGGNGAQNVPTTYHEMFLFNAAVMGFGDSPWMKEVLACFHNIVTNVANSARLAEEADVLALRIAKVSKGAVNYAEYKSCMLASLRSLLPKDWDTAHEVAWNWLWENVERLVVQIQGKPAQWEKALGKILSSLTEEEKFEIRKEIYAAFSRQPLQVRPTSSSPTHTCTSLQTRSWA